MLRSLVSGTALGIDRNGGFERLLQGHRPDRLGDELHARYRQDLVAQTGYVGRAENDRHVGRLADATGGEETIPSSRAFPIYWAYSSLPPFPPCDT